MIKLPCLIELQDIHKTYQLGEQTVHALDGVSLNIEQGELLAIVGPSGAGKSTVIDLILGLVDPDDGSLLVDNIIINNANKRSWQDLIGFVPQSIFLSEGTIAENIAFGVAPENINMPQVKDAAKKAMIEREQKRQKLVDKFAAKRADLKAIARNQELPMEERFAARLKLAKLPRNSSATRLHNRCQLTGRPHAYYRKLRISRIMLRELGSNGQLPGVVKSSW